MNCGEERCAMTTKEFEDLVRATVVLTVSFVRRPSRGRSGRAESREMIGEIQRDPAVSLADRFDADPDDLARRHQRVEHRRLIVGHSRRQHVAFEHRRGNGCALQMFDRVEQRVVPAPGRANPVP